MADSFHIGQIIVFEERMRLAVNLFKHPFLSTPSSGFTRRVESCSALGLHSWCMRRGACILAPATLQGTRTAYLCRSGCTGSCTSRCRPPTSGLPIRTRSILAGVFALPLARPKRGVVAAGLAPGDLVLAASLAVPHRALRARSVRAAGVLPRAALLAHLDRWHRAEHAVASLTHRVPLGLRRRVVLLALPLAGVLIRRRRLQVGLALGLEKGGWQDPNFGAWSDMGPARSSAPCTGLLVRTPRRRR